MDVAASEFYNGKYRTYDLNLEEEAVSLLPFILYSL